MRKAFKTNESIKKAETDTDSNAHAQFVYNLTKLLG